MDEERKDVPEGGETPSLSSSEQGTQTPAPDAPRTSGMAIASLVTAILCAPVGVVLGIVALTQIKKNPERLTGSGLAIAGIVVGAVIAVVVFIAAIMAAMLFPVFARARESANTASCMSNVKQVGVAILMYVDDHENVYPPASTWNDSIRPYLKNDLVLMCPRDKSGQVSYTMNSELSGFPVRQLVSPAGTVMVFDSVPGPNQRGGPELLPEEPRHPLGHVVGFADGHVSSVAASEVDSLHWDPSVAPAQPVDEEDEAPWSVPERSPFG